MKTIYSQEPYITSTYKLEKTKMPHENTTDLNAAALAIKPQNFFALAIHASAQVPKSKKSPNDGNGSNPLIEGSSKHY